MPSYSALSTGLFEVSRRENRAARNRIERQDVLFGMLLFTFVSDKDTDILGFTPDRTGASLPAEWGPWNPLGTGTLPASVGLAGIGHSEPVQEAIRKDGYYVVRARG
jgi:hypothetical protein